jgi:uncharacterized membrane protein YgcG
MSRTRAAFAGIRRAPRPGLLCALLLLVFAAVAPAAARSWSIPDYQDTILVGADGSAYIEERISLAFVGQFQGIHRIIPIQYPGPHGENFTLFLQLREVTDGEGRPLHYTAARRGAYLDLTIYLPDAYNNTRVVRLTYTVANAVRFFQDHDEFYWNITGNDWPVPIEHAAASVIFPDRAAGSLRAQAFTGQFGARGLDSIVSTDGAQAAIEAVNPLPIHEGLTVDIFVPQGILTPPGAITRLGWFLRSNLIVLLPILACAVMFLLWWYKGNDPDAGLFVVPLDQPPAGLNPAEAGTLVTDSVEPRDIACTLVDLAVRGFVKIEETEDPHLPGSRRDYIFASLQSRLEWNALKPYECSLLEHLFHFGDTVTLSNLRNRFYAAVPAIRRDLLDGLREQGLYTLNPQRAPACVAVAAVLLCVPFLLLHLFGVVDFARSPLLLAGSLLVTIAVIVLFARQMTPKSLLGVNTRLNILGFQEFINGVEAEHVRTLPPDTFEKYLPFAMALGLECRWAQAFQDVLHEPPHWFVVPPSPSDLTWDPLVFTQSLDSMSTDLHAIMAMAPRSSSSGSGFSGGEGGGFSDGGSAF